MVSLASPTNGVSDRLVSPEPVSSLAHIRGKRVIDATVTDNGGGYNHIRGNHMLYVLEPDWNCKMSAGWKSLTKCRASFAWRSSRR